MQTFHFLFLLSVLSAPLVEGFDICAAGEPYSAIKAVKSGGCSGCSDYLLCVGFRNAVTQCGLISASDANTTATIISANNGASGFANYISTYLGVTYNPVAVSNGLNGADCKALYGSSRRCRVGPIPDPCSKTPLPTQIPFPPKNPKIPPRVREFDRSSMAVSGGSMREDPFGVSLPTITCGLPSSLL